MPATVYFSSSITNSGTPAPLGFSFDWHVPFRSLT